ncbi:MAG: hypothetical protein IMX04_00815 [Candidatus Carbobacillus altaicus]|nr:hypothetical protein [Candidatus Carbobacillus altaicus]
MAGMGRLARRTLIVGLLLFGRRLSSRTSSAPVHGLSPFPGQGASR